MLETNNIVYIQLKDGSKRKEGKEKRGFFGGEGGGNLLFKRQGNNIADQDLNGQKKASGLGV